MMATPSPSEDAAATATAAAADTTPPSEPDDTTVSYRMEHDLIGDEKVPKDAYYGIQTQRA